MSYRNHGVVLGRWMFGSHMHARSALVWAPPPTEYMFVIQADEKPAEHGIIGMCSKGHSFGRFASPQPLPLQCVDKDACAICATNLCFVNRKVRCKPEMYSGSIEVGHAIGLLWTRLAMIDSIGKYGRLSNRLIRGNVVDVNWTVTRALSYSSVNVGDYFHAKMLTKP